MTISATDKLEIAGEKFDSRLIVGTGKYRSNEEMRLALEASGTQIVTVAIKRIDLKSSGGESFMGAIDGRRYKLLPNTAGCASADEAIFTAQLARETLETNWIKLEVIEDERYLLPDMVETVRAAEELNRLGFVVLPYIGADPVAARRLEKMNCATVMPLGSPIGSGRGLLTADEIAIIVRSANVPVVVDAGIGVPSEASQAMEMGADAVLVNSAIARAKDPVLMAKAFKAGVESGRMAYLAGRMAASNNAVASSPIAERPRLASD